MTPIEKLILENQFTLLHHASCKTNISDALDKAITRAMGNTRAALAGKEPPADTTDARSSLPTWVAREPKEPFALRNAEWIDGKVAIFVDDDREEIQPCRFRIIPPSAYIPERTISFKPLSFGGTVRIAFYDGGGQCVGNVHLGHQENGAVNRVSDWPTTPPPNPRKH